MDIDEQILQQSVAKVLGWTHCALTRLPGATSAAVFLASCNEVSCVVKVFDERRWETPGRELSERESIILQTLAGSGVPAPALLAQLPDNGFVMSRAPGQVWLPAEPGREWILAQAERLTDIHSVRSELPWHYSSWNETQDAPAPDWWQDAALWTEAQRLTAAEPAYASTFLHRDYHPVNLLWENEHISGIVDWTNACMGPAGIDVAHCRLNLALMYGGLVADDFLSAYCELNPHFRFAAYWDLDDALGALPQPKVYPPWVEFGLSGLNDELIRQRLLAFVHAAVDNEGYIGATP